MLPLSAVATHQGVLSINTLLLLLLLLLIFIGINQNDFCLLHANRDFSSTLTFEQNIVCALSISWRVVVVASRDFCANLLPLYEDCMAHVTSLGQRRRRVIPLVTSAMERPVTTATNTITSSSPNSNRTTSGAQTSTGDSRLYHQPSAATSVTTTASSVATSLLGVPVLRVDEAEAATRLIERLQQGT